MAITKKNLVKYKVCDLDIGCGITPESLAKVLQNAIKDHSSAGVPPEFEDDSSLWDGHEEWRIVAWRKKNEKELARAKRRRESAKKSAAKRKQKKLDKEREQYEKLKEKFEP